MEHSHIVWWTSGNFFKSKMKKSSIKENPLQIHLISWKIHSKLVSTILEFFFQKVDRKSMDDMGITEIVSEVLFGPNILERHPTWQVSSLKKIFCFFVWSLLPKLGGPTLDKILTLFLTLFFNEKVKNLKICLWRDHITTWGVGVSFHKMVWMIHRYYSL